MFACICFTCKSPEGLCAVMLCYVMSAAAAVVSVRREETCLQFLWILAFSSGLLAHTLPTMGSVNGVNSETAGIMSRISNATGVVNRIPSW